MLFIAIEAIYVTLNLKNKKVPMSAITTRLTEDDLSRMQVASASEAVEKAQEAGFVKVDSAPGGGSLVSFATDEVRLYWTLNPVFDAVILISALILGQGHARHKASGECTASE